MVRKQLVKDYVQVEEIQHAFGILWSPLYLSTLMRNDLLPPIHVLPRHPARQPHASRTSSLTTSGHHVLSPYSSSHTHVHDHDLYECQQRGESQLRPIATRISKNFGMIRHAPCPSPEFLSLHGQNATRPTTISYGTGTGYSWDPLHLVCLSACTVTATSQLRRGSNCRFIVSSLPVAKHLRTNCP